MHAHHLPFLIFGGMRPGYHVLEDVRLSHRRGGTFPDRSMVATPPPGDEAES
jgi:hypothetical protein